MRSAYWDRVSRQKQNRRRFLAVTGTATAGLTGLAITGCGDDDSSPPADATGSATSSAGAGSPAATQPTTRDISKMSLEEMRTAFSGARFKDLEGQAKGPTPGGMVRWASRTPVTWDPTSPAGSTLASHVLAHNQLLQFKVDDWVENPNFMEIEPVLAESMPEQPDDQTFVFHLRKGVKFQNVAPVNGREFTADDVLYCLEAYKKAPAQNPTFMDLASVEKPDDYTIVFKMKAPAAYFIGTFSVPIHWIFSREQHTSADGLAKTPIGTGAYIFESSENLGGYKFKKNPDYFRVDERTGKKLPYLDGVQVAYFPSTAQSLAAFRSGELDVLWAQNYDDLTNLVKSHPDTVVQITTPPPSFQPHIAMRIDKPPLNDPRVRRALSMLIDRDAIIESLAGGLAGYGYGQDWTYFGSEWPFGKERLGQWHAYNPGEAEKLLDAAGAKSLELYFLMSQTAGFNYEVWSAIAGMWEAAGLKVTIDAPQDPAQWQKQFYTGNYESLVGTGFLGPGWDPDTFAYHALHSGSPKNYYHVKDTTIDDLALRQRHIMDRAERTKVLDELMTYDLDQVTRLWTVAPYKINARKPNVFNVIDTEAAWSTVGWGSSGMDKAWKLA